MRIIDWSSDVCASDLDGLVHISALSEKFIKDPREAVKAGDVVKVKVMEVDIARKRVGLSMRMSDTPGEKVDGARGARTGRSEERSVGKEWVSTSRSGWSPYH